MTEVVNIAYEERDVYIGRGDKENGEKSHLNNTEVGEHGWLGNPYVTEEHGGEYTREESIEKYAYDFQRRIETDSEFREAVKELRGKKLGCYCKPQPCHGDVIVEYLKTLKTTTGVTE